MKLVQLKTLTHDFWIDVLTIRRVVIDPNSFKAELKDQFGDLRQRTTWEKALARYYAQIVHDACLDASNLILYGLNFKPGDRLYPYRHGIFEEFLAFSDGLEMLKTGLEDIFQTNNFTPQERQDAKDNGFFELVREQSPGGTLNGRTTELTGQLQGTR
jgi:hypothetical protein